MQVACLATEAILLVVHELLCPMEIRQISDKMTLKDTLNAVILHNEVQTKTHNKIFLKAEKNPILKII